MNRDFHRTRDPKSTHPSMAMHCPNAPNASVPNRILSGAPISVGPNKHQRLAIAISQTGQARRGREAEATDSASLVWARTFVLSVAEGS